MAFRRARLWVASLIALALGAAAATFVHETDIGRSLELAVSDKLRAANPLPDDASDAPLTTIEIDDASIQHPDGGRWPWDRTRQAAMIDALAACGARLIVLDIEYAEPEGPCTVRRPTAAGTRELTVVPRPDEPLRQAVERAGNVLLPFSLYIKGRDGAGDLPKAVRERADAGLEILRPFALDLPPSAAPAAREAEGYNPMLAELAAAAAGAGYTSIQRDPEDNTVRRVPLVARGGPVLLPHLGLEMAGQWRFGPDYRVRLEGGRLWLSAADGAGAVSAPVDERVQLDLRWPTSLAAMDRISAGPVLDVMHAQQELADHRLRWRLVMESLDALFPEASWSRAARSSDEATARAAASPADAALAAAASEARAALEKCEERLAMGLLTPPDDAPAGADPAAADLAQRRAEAAERFGPFIAAYHDALGVLEKDVQAAADRVRPRVQGRLCIVGMNATGITDQHRTPISSSQPGVTVYTCVVRTLFSGVAFRRIPAWQEWALALLAAWLVGLLGTRLPTGWGIAAGAAVSVAVGAAAVAASARAAVLLPVAGPASAVVVAFAGVSAYRQLTEARSRRWVTRMFRQYNSETLLREIQRNPHMLRLGGARREITVLFSDIAGFTPISEKIPPDRLVPLLNRYLSAMTEVLLGEGGTLDKYEGDGIMFFFGAPVDMPDHALRCVRAALGMHAALPGINQDLLAQGLLPPGTALRVRVGCASGPAAVGNFGSEQRFAFTCMGDTVNLAARLEEAGRWAGTRILVPESTRAACDGAVLFRRLGPARIRGKADEVTLYEPLAAEPAPDDLRRLADATGRAVDALAAGDASAAASAVAEMQTICPDDGVAAMLAVRVEDARAGREAPGDPWNFAKSK
jgi:class 3 adenylate cyclase